MGGKGKGKGRKGGKSSGKGKGRKGGKSSGKGKGKSSVGRPLQFSAPSRGAPPLPQDPGEPFLHPQSRPLVVVPLEFHSLQHWCDVIGNNILAEFWNVYREGGRGFSGFGHAAGDELIIENAPSDGFVQHLLIIDRQPRIVTSQRLLGVGKVALKLKGGSARTGHVKSIGYIGSYLAEFAATIELRKLPPKELTAPMRAILEPKVELSGHYAYRPLRASIVPVNPSQRRTIESLRFALEKIQGPPGTGKSTTIFHVLDAKVPQGERVLVTCSRNVAVESIAQKLAALEGWPLCVFGPRDRVGETAREHLLDTQVGGHFDDRKLSAIAPRIAEQARRLSDAITARERRCKGLRGEKFLLAFIRKRYALTYALRDLCERVGAYCATAAKVPEWCKEQTNQSKEVVLTQARVFLCTIASTSRMLREWEEVTGTELRVHTVIVDECGCTPESSTALLLRLRPHNLVMVGDHKQLPPCSLVQPQLLEGTGHTRSLLERCVLASGHVHQLLEQYRMHASISALVSRLFYAGRLQTPPQVAKARAARESRPLVWLDVQGREEAPERSYMNQAEVSASVRVCLRLREVVGDGPSIALLTFYRGQLDALMHAVPSALGIEVLTVDACQGSEFDYVVLSTVRANGMRRLGFIKDPQRINVAISRSKLKLVVVGSRATLSTDGDWNQVSLACAPALPQETSPQRSLPPGPSVFDALAQLKAREAQQKVDSQLEEARNGGKSSGGKGGGKGKRSAPSGVDLMEHQRSFQKGGGSYYSGYGSQGGAQRRNDGTYQSSTLATVIGGGFRRRVDIAEAESMARHHQASLDRPSSSHVERRFHVPKSKTEFNEVFPELGCELPEPDWGIGMSEPYLPPKPLRSGALRASTRNDEKKARRTAKRLGSAEAEEVWEEPPLVSHQFTPAPVMDGFNDVDEVMLFEMFPDDAAAVEEALRRFSGLTHAAARALEALLARTVVAESKTVLEGEEDLDYDCAVGVTEECGEDAQATAEFEEDWPEEDWDGDGDCSWTVAPGICAACGEAADVDVAEDGPRYCVRCWADWEGVDVDGVGEELDDDGFWESSGEVPAATAQVARVPPGLDLPAFERPPAPPVPAQCLTQGPSSGLGSSEPKVASKTMPTARVQARAAERVNFLDALDGAAKWSEAPPDLAVDAELVALQPKEERGGAKSKTATGRRWNRGAFTPEMPTAAATQAPIATQAEDRSSLCRTLLGGLDPQMDEDTIEYLTSLIEDDVSDDTRESVFEILEGHGVAGAATEVFWQALVAGA